MRNTVTFYYPAPLVTLSPEDGIFSVQGTGWFLNMLRTIPSVDVSQHVVQEDWGVAIRVRRAGRRYWIGLSGMSEHEWIAHVHHDSFAWLQRFSSGGQQARVALVGEVDQALRVGNASGLRWFDERDLNLRAPTESPV